MTESPISPRTDRIRQLNDLFRRGIGAGRVLWTGDMGQEEDATRLKAYAAVAAFVAFDQGNDPYGEHDFGSFDMDGEKVMFKIDYYNANYDEGAADPADPVTTRRLLSIFYARDY